MADPITAGLVIAAVASTVSAGMGTASAVGQQKAQSKMAQYQAERAHEAGIQSRNTAAANEATSIRQSAGQLGEQAAAFGQANIGTGGSARDVERQSAANARLDALNIWYGGELEQRGYEEEAKMARYQALVSKRNADMALISGGIQTGTQAVMGATNVYGYTQKGIIPFRSTGGSPY